MMKRLITYQRLLLNSIPQVDALFKNPLELLLSVFGVLVICFMTLSTMFMKDSISLNTIFFLVLPITSIWMTNRIFHSGPNLFTAVPVSRKYTLLNLFLLSIVITVILYLILYIFEIVAIGLVFGILYFWGLQPFSKADTTQILDITKGNLLMLCILVIILFAGTAITVIKNKKLRLISFGGLTLFVYGFLFFLKLKMLTYSKSNKLEFLESFSIMPQVNTILICVVIATILICVTSLCMGYNLYVPKASSNK